MSNPPVSWLWWILRPWNARARTEEKKRNKRTSYAFRVLVVVGGLIGIPVITALLIHYGIEPRLAFASAIVGSFVIPVVIGKLARAIVPGELRRPSIAASLAWLLLLIVYAIALFALNAVYSASRERSADPTGDEKGFQAR